jgi:hypothetical protein
MLKLDLNTYAVNRPFIQEYYRDHPYENIDQMVSIWGPAIHCPNIALYFYIAEMVGFTPELVKSIKSMIKQYDYDIVNQKPGSPFIKPDRKK